MYVRREESVRRMFCFVLEYNEVDIVLVEEDEDKEARKELMS